MTQISLRLSQREKEHLQKYCELTERNQTEVLRDLVRRLSIKGALNPTQLPWGVHVSRHQSSGYGAGLIAPQTPRQLNSES